MCFFDFGLKCPFKLRCCHETAHLTHTQQSPSCFVLMHGLELIYNFTCILILHRLFRPLLDKLGTKKKKFYKPHDMIAVRHG